MKRDMTLTLIALISQSWIRAAVYSVGVFQFIFNTLYAIVPMVGSVKSDSAY